ncbi:hypothetical protein [Acinetobacter nosocomialis]|uniref:hypothetical protein n=1 Tax=Acinetobacter nosocomialis TaxID=106654 RepID=UPI001FD6822C|nr:hypothetical protein [Acinetobacter nosocomialis]
MNKELQSFSRNIASQIFIGGTGLLFLYRADTKPGLVYYEFFGLYIVGLLLLTWSMYMALSNATILRNRPLAKVVIASSSDLPVQRLS